VFYHSCNNFQPAFSAGLHDYWFWQYDVHYERAKIQKNRLYPAASILWAGTGESFSELLR